MEDLYKILPLTVETLFEEAPDAICCQFDTLNDLQTANKILQLVFATELASGKSQTAKKKKEQSSLLQRLLQAIWCRKRPADQDAKDEDFTVGKDTPVKQIKKQTSPLLFPNKKGTIEFQDVIDQVKNALGAFDAALLNPNRGYFPDSELDE